MIAICDDEKKISAELEDVLVDIFAKLSIKCNIEVFFTAKELCRQIETNNNYDLIFLDIELSKDEINGVEVGRLIRDTYQNDAVQIVYISWEKRYSMQLFDMRPLNFLVKPLDYDKIEQVIKTYLKVTGVTSEKFIYKKGHDTFKVLIKDIVYLENHRRKIIIHLVDGRKESFYGSLKKIFSEQLEKNDFLFIHASYAINYDYISVVKYSQVILADCENPLPISHNKRSEIREKYYSILRSRKV